MDCEASTSAFPAKPILMDMSQGSPLHVSPTHSANKTPGSRNTEKDSEQLRKLRRLEQAGIKVMTAAQRYGSRLAPCYGIHAACLTFLALPCCVFVLNLLLRHYQ